MGRFRIFFLFSVCFAFFSAFAYAQSNIVFSIQLHNQQVYFAQDPVFVRIRIYNNSANVYSFRFADNQIHNVEFDIQGSNGMTPVPSNSYIQNIAAAGRTFYRSVELLPGEEFSFIENLQDYVELAYGFYTIQARFFPALRGNNEQIILMSNSLTINIRDQILRDTRVQLQIDELKQVEVQRAMLSPDEVLAYILDSRIRSENNKFLLYLDIERLYIAHPSRREMYIRSSARQQRDIIEQFTQELTHSTIDEEISLIPYSYTILRTMYDQNFAEVVVDQLYDQGNFSIRKQFTYNLERKDRAWYIVNYTVINTGIIQ